MNPSFMNLYYRYNAAIFEEVWTSSAVIEFISRDERHPLLHIASVLVCVAVFYFSKVWIGFHMYLSFIVCIQFKISAFMVFCGIIYALWNVVTEGPH